MKCYYHETRDAVAQCNRCGKLICKECAEKRDPPICPDCAKTEEAKNKRSMKITVMLSAALGLEGLAVGVFPILSLFTQGNFSLGGFLMNLLLTALIAFVMAGIPFGWRYLNKITSKMFLFLPVIGWVIYLYLKLILSVFAGIYALPKYIIDRHKKG